MSETYTLLLRSDERHSRPADREGLIGHLLRIPGAVETAPDRFEFGDADEHGVMELDAFVHRDGQRLRPEDVRDDEAGRCDEMEVRIPRPWVMERGPRVFALVFMLAEWAKWEVFDPQIGDSLQKEAVLSGLVAMRQAQREHEAARESQAGRSSEEAVREVPDYTPGGSSSDSSRAGDAADSSGAANGTGDAPKRRRPWWKKLG